MPKINKVYVAMIADLLHAGHIRILAEAVKHGEVTVGLLTANAVAEMDDVAYLKYAQRHEVLEQLRIVKDIIPQETASYRANLLSLKPHVVVHGDDWVTGKSSMYRTEVVELLAQWGGTLLEVSYSSEISDQNIKEQLHRLGVVSLTRQQRLRQMLITQPISIFLEVHNALSGLIVENTKIEVAGATRSFDGFWSSSLTDSTSRGKPDIEAVDISSRMTTVNEIFEVTTKPLIFDADTGGLLEHFEFTVKSLERVGVSAVIIEDKTGLKKNSLLGNSVPQTQATIEDFCSKIAAGKKAQSGDDFMIIARVESLILEAGMQDALTRAIAYVNAGADGIMIHSRKKTPDEIKAFVKLFRELDETTPLVVVPTTFNAVTVEEFRSAGVNILIYANHLLRASYPAMQAVARSILFHGRSLEAEDECMSINDVLEFIPGTR
jgi:phosphoenolpyruvate phosphomutase